MLHLSRKKEGALFREVNTNWHVKLRVYLFFYETAVSVIMLHSLFRYQKESE